MSGMQPPQWPPWAPQGRAARLRWQIRTWSHRTRMRAVFWWRREVRWRWRPTCSLCGGWLEPGEIAEPGSPYPYRCPECGGQCTGWFATDGTEYCDDNDDAWGRQPWERAAKTRALCGRNRARSAAAGLTRTPGKPGRTGRRDHDRRAAAAGRPELRAWLAQLAAMRIVKFRENQPALTDAIATSLRLAAGWAEPDARGCAAQVAAEALSWTPGQLLEQMSADLNATNGMTRDLEEAEITTARQRLRARRQAERRENEREQAEAAAAEGPVVIRSGCGLTGRRFGPLVFAVPGLIPEGVTILGGLPKGGKSWLVLSVGLSLASGGKILGALRNGAPRPVLYLALEDSDRRMQRRCAELGYHQIPEKFEYITQCRPGRVLEEIAAWLGSTRASALSSSSTPGAKS